MPLGQGLNLGVGGGVRVGKTLGGPPATIAQTAYGSGSSPTSADGKGLKSWHLMVSVPIASVGWLCFLRWSLPK